MTKIFQIHISVLLSIVFLLTSCRNTTETYSSTNPVVLCDDQTVINLLGENIDKSLPELSDISEELFLDKKYKEAYNIDKYALSKSETYESKMTSYAYMALSYSMVRNSTKAKYYFEKSLALVDNTDEILRKCNIYNLSGNTYYDISTSKSWDYAAQAIDCYEKSLSLNPAYVGLSTDDAFLHYKRAACMFLSLIYMESPQHFNPNKAIEYANKAREADSDTAAFAYTLCLAYLYKNDFYNAKVYLDINTQSEPSSILNKALHLMYYTKSNDLKNAKKYYSDVLKSVKSKHNETAAFMALGLYCESIGDPDTAKKYYTQIAENNNEYNSDGKDNVNSKFIIDAEKRLGLNFDYVREKLIQQQKENSKITLEIAGAEDEAAIALGIQGVN